MDPFTYAKELNIRRFQNLLDTSVDEIERRNIQALLAKEKAKAEPQAIEDREK